MIYYLVQLKSKFITQMSHLLVQRSIHYIASDQMIAGATEMLLTSTLIAVVPIKMGHSLKCNLPQEDLLLNVPTLLIACICLGRKKLLIS